VEWVLCGVVEGEDEEESVGVGGDGGCFWVVFLAEVGSCRRSGNDVRIPNWMNVCRSVNISDTVG